HKTTVSTEQMLIQIIKRARYLVQQGKTLFSTSALSFFLKNEVDFESFKANPSHINYFASLDDFDIWGSIKVWANDEDRILSLLSKMLLERKLFKVELSNKKNDIEIVNTTRKQLATFFNISFQDTKFLCNTGKITNKGYLSHNQNILIKTKKGDIIDVAKASDLPNIEALSKIVKKFYLCYPKVLSL
ncbi:MAG: phosphohydrolase, partial [Bacteroidota bacterium]